MAYKSKYTGFQVEGLLDKADTSVQPYNLKTIDGYSIIGDGDIAITSQNKGYFTTSEDLAEMYPIGSPGNIAYVGSTYPYSIYKWNDSRLSWIDSGEFGGDESINLNNYATKNDVGDILSQMFIAVSTEEELRDMLESGDYDSSKIYYVIEE